MAKRQTIVYIHHDRHTDDHIETFPYSKENWELAKEKCRRDWGNASTCAGPSETTALT